MNCNEQCFGCHGLYDVNDDVASSRRSSLNVLIEDLDVEESDISTIRDFYNQYKKSYDTTLCWDCALFCVLGYTDNTMIRGMEELGPFVICGYDVSTDSISLHRR